MASAGHSDGDKGIAVAAVVGATDVGAVAVATSVPEGHQRWGDK